MYPDKNIGGKIFFDCFHAHQGKNTFFRIVGLYFNVVFHTLDVQECVVSSIWMNL